MAFKNSDTEDEMITDINITPVADLFLVLLIIFMVTSSSFNSNGVKVDLPQASSASESNAPEATILTLNKEGKVFLNSQEVALDSLEATLKEALSKAKMKFVIFEGDTTTQLGTAVKVMDIAKKAGASELAIATDTGLSPAK